MVDCDIYNVSLEAFKGLESYLHTLDVSNNNITEFPVWKLQQGFNMLMKLGLRDNKIKNIFPIHVEGPPPKNVKPNEKKKSKDKTPDRDERVEHKGVHDSRDHENHHEFYSLQDFDFSGWKNGPLKINVINGYVKIILK